MWQPFTLSSRQAILEAQEQAKKLKSPSVGTGHLLLGLLCDHRGIVVHILQEMSVPPEKLRPLLEAELLSDNKISELTLSPLAKRTLEMAADEARHMQHRDIRPEHILLALLRGNVIAEPGSGLAAKALIAMRLSSPKESPERPSDVDCAATVLHQFGLNQQRVREVVLQLTNSANQRFSSTAYGDLQHAPAHNTKKFDVTPEVQSILELAAESAPQTGYDTITVEHCLIALCHDPTAPLTEILVDCGLDTDKLIALMEKRLAAALPPEEIRDLQKKLKELNRQKELAVNNDEYEEAALLRDQADEVDLELRTALDEWRSKAQSEQTVSEQEEQGK